MASRSLGVLSIDLVAKIGGFTGPLEKAQREAEKQAKQFAAAQKINERAINTTLAAMDREVAMLGKTAKEQKLFELAARGATEAQLAQAESAINAVDSYEQQQDAMRASVQQATSLGKALDALDAEVAALGKTAKEQKLLELAANGATKAQLAQAKAALDSVDNFERQREAMRKNVEQAKAFGKYVATAFAAGGAAIVANTAYVVKSARELENLARVADENVENFQNLAYASKPFGVEQEKLSDILKDVNDKVGDFLTTGQGPLADFFDGIAPRVGLTADAFRDLSGSQALGLYISSLEKAGVSQAEMTFFMEAIAGDATLLLPLFRDNARELNRLTGEAKSFGVALTEIEIGQLKEVDQAFRELSAQGKALSQDIAVAALPAVKDFIAVLSDPQSIANIESFGAAVVRTFTAVTEAISTTVGVVDFLAEAMAAKIHGPAIDDTVRLGEAIDSVNEKIAQLEGRLSSRTINRGHWEQQLEEMKAERERLQILLDFSNDAEPAKRSQSGASAGTSPVAAQGGNNIRADTSGFFAALEEENKELEKQQKIIDDLRQSAGDYQADLARQVALMGAQTEAERALYEIEKGRFADLNAAQKEAILNQARMLDHATASAEGDAFLEQLQQQADMILLQTDYERTLYDLQKGRFAGLDESQKAAIANQAEILKGMQAQVDVEREYKELVAELRTDEEKRTDQLKERLAILEEMSAVPDAEKQETLSRAVETAFDTDPEKQDSDDFEAQRTALKAWYEEQAEMLEEFRATRADLNTQWDEQEEATRAEYEQRLTDINVAAEEDRRAQLAEGFSSLLSVASKYYEGMEGEEAAYTRAALQLGQVLLDDKKMASVESIIASTNAAAMGAYESLSSIPYIGPALGAAAALGIYAAGGVASAAVLGMAHDGIDSIPQTGTWLLEKGERVTTAETSAKLDSTLDRIGEGQGSGGDVVVNLIEDREKAGQVNQRVDPGNEQTRIIDVFVANIQSDGRAAQAIQNKWGLSPRGR